MKNLSIQSVQTFWDELEKIGEFSSVPAQLGQVAQNAATALTDAFKTFVARPYGTRARISFVKRAASAQEEHNANSIKDMEPGDIIVASPGPPSERATASSQFQDWLFTKASPYWQGRFTHAGIYAGDGKTIEAYPQGIIKRDASELLKGRSYVVIRPKVPEEKRLAAVEFAESQLGKPYSKTDLIRAAARTLVPSSVASVIGGSPNIPDQKHEVGYQCGGLVAASYAAAGAPLAKVNPKYVPPVELLANPKARVVGLRMRKQHEMNEPVVGWLKGRWKKNLQEFDRRSSKESR